MQVCSRLSHLLALEYLRPNSWICFRDLKPRTLHSMANRVTSSCLEVLDVSARELSLAGWWYCIAARCVEKVYATLFHNIHQAVLSCSKMMFTPWSCALLSTLVTNNDMLASQGCVRASWNKLINQIGSTGAVLFANDLLTLNICRHIMRP